MSDVKEYLRELLDAAEEYIGAKKFNVVRFFYRNKPEEYFDNVKRYKHVMMKLKKDKNGDKRSPINGKISGVFLSVSLQGGKLPSASPFGNTRIQFPIQAVFNDDTNLFFTDFYCSTSTQHYVTLVMTKKGSDEDVFCRRRCLQLDLENNPFLRRRQTGDNVMFTTINKPGLLIEVLYTENINIAQLKKIYGSDAVFYTKTDIIGKGTSTWGGLRKKTSCSICNPCKKYSLEIEEVIYERTRRDVPPVFRSTIYGVTRKDAWESCSSTTRASYRPATEPRPTRPETESSWGSLGLLVAVGAGILALAGMFGKSD